MALTTHTQHQHMGIRMPTELIERARRVAEAEERSVSYIVRRALRHELERTANTHDHKG